MDEVRAVSEASAGRKRPDLKGWKDIANRLDVSVDTAMRYYRLPVDPLPVVKDRFGRPMAFSSAIDAWLDRELIPGRVYDELKTLRAATRGLLRHRGEKQRKTSSKKVA